MASTVHDLATRLASEGVGTLNTNLFRGRMPDQPDDCLAVIEYAGSPGRLKLPNDRPLDERPRAQIVSRAKLYKTAETKARAAYTAMHGRHLTLNNSSYVWLHALQLPFFLREDESGRTLIVFNVEMRRRHAP